MEYDSAYWKQFRNKLKRKLKKQKKRKAKGIAKIKRSQWARDKKVFAAKINLKLPDSEKWFWREWENAGMKLESDKPNEVYCGFIPDVINHKFKYVIEVDGTIHQLDRVKKWDDKKNKFYSRKGMTVFRVEAYNYEHMAVVVDEVSKMREKRLTA